MILERYGDLIVTSTGEQPLEITADGVNRLSSFKSRDPLTKTAMESLQQRSQDITTIQETERITFKFNGNKYFLVISPFQDTTGLDWLVCLSVNCYWFRSYFK